MKLYIVIGLAILALLSLLSYGLNKYIDDKANTIASKAILESKLEYQNKEIEIKRKLELEYKTKIKKVEQSIQNKIPVIITDKTCQSELDAINTYLKRKWNK